MTQHYTKCIKEINLLGDVVSLNIAYLLVYMFTIGGLDTLLRTRYFKLQLFFNIAWILSAYLVKVHDTSRTVSFERVIRKLLNALGLFLVLIFAFLGLKGDSFYKLFVFHAYVYTSLALFVFNLAMVFFLKYYRKIGYNYRKVIIAGYGDIATELRKFFTFHPEHGYKFFGYFDDLNTSPLIRGKIREIEKIALDKEIDEIYCCLPYMDYHDVQRLIKFGEDNFIKVRVIPDFRGFPYKGVEVMLYDYIPVLDFRPQPLDDEFNNVLKRGFDVVFSLFVIIFIMSWLTPLMALLIKLDSKGPAFFKQYRSGRNNEPFVCYKFRTMRVNRDSDKKQATKNDVRITKIGRFLRKSNLDEMPQFFNVLKGQMSVVGPRPHMISHTEEFSQQIDRFMLRHHVKPGITGLAQAKGYRGETNTDTKLKNRIKLDRFYVENWSLMFDVKIIALTVISMIKGDENAY
jgi:putative colanic acid biosynthesis UDP-glucose lipid carrier transferase